MKINKQLDRDNRILFIWIASMAMLLLPFVVTIFLSTPDSCDDFDNAIGIKQNGAYFTNSIGFANYLYQTWSGEWPCNFVMGITNPLAYGVYDGNSHIVGVVLSGFFIIFIAFLIIYMYHLEKYVLDIGDRRIRLSITFLVTFMIMNSNMYREVYYWFTGNSYLWRVIALLICHTFIIRFVCNDKVSDCILLSVIGFITCFSNLMAVFTGLFLLYMLWKHEKLCRVKSYIPLVFMLAGGCISAFAPGNFARHNARAGTSSLNIKGAVVHTLQNTIDSLIDIYTSSIVLIAIVILLFIGYFYVKDHIGSISIMATACIVSLAGTIFPLALGYADAELPRRVMYIVNMIMYIWTVMISLEAGCILRDKFADRLSSECLAIILVICLVGFAVTQSQLNANGNMRIMDLPAVKTAQGIGHAMEESRYYRWICKSISESDEQDVTVYVQPGKEISEGGILQPIRLNSDSSDPRNNAVAAYYGKNSVSVIVLQE